MKKRGKILQEIVSLTLVFSICCSMFSSPVAAENSTTDAQALVDSGDLTVTSENSVGDLLANTIDENQQDTSEACYVTDLEITGSTATVSFQTLMDSDIVVGIYTEDGKQLLASGTVAVTSEEDSVTVTLNGEMPEYFVASAYLLDAESHQPLSEEYTTQLYTYEMQQLISKTTADFDPDLVVNLDDDPNTNFAVFSEDTVMVEETAGTNVLTDNGNGTYTVVNADNSVMSLQPGDVFTYEQGEDLLVIVVENITVNGTTVTITEKADADLADAFEYVKIEANSANGDITYGNGNTAYQNDYGVNTYGLFDPDDPLDWSNTQTLDILNFNEPNLKGSVSLKIKESLTCYVVDKDLYLRVQIDLQLPVNLTISGKLDKTYDFELVKYQPFPAVWIVCTPALIFKANGTIEVKNGIEAAIGFEFDSRREVPISNVSKSPHLMENSALEINATLYVGISLKPEIKLAIDFGWDSLEVVSGYIYGETGLEVEGQLKYTNSNPDNIIHDCYDGLGCIEGTIDWKGKISAGIKISFVDKPWEKELINKTVKLCDFYYSLTYNEFDLSVCPHYMYKVTVEALDKYGNPIPATIIYGTSLPEDPVTDENGKVSFYLGFGQYTFEINYNGGVCSRSFIISEPRQIVLQMTEKNTHMENNTGFGGVNVSMGNVDFDEVDSDAEVNKQKCGDNVYWTLENGKLIITGTGEMHNYYTKYQIPWYDYKENITSVYIGQGITTIGDYTFCECNNLKSITIPQGIISIGQSAFLNCVSLTSITILEGLIIIKDNAFSGCSSLAKIQIPKGLISIGTRAFYGCANLMNIVIPEGVTAIGNFAFGFCKSLINITLSDGITSVGSSAFYYCTALQNIVIPKGVTSIGDHAFYGCSSLMNIIILDGVNLIENYTFAGCSSLTSITIPNGITSIGNHAFYDCSSLTSIMIPNGVTSIGDYAFYGCSSLASIAMPNGVTSIGDYTFYDCSSLTSITIPNGVTLIGDHAFYDCSSLTNIMIPDGVNLIENYTFAECSSLASIMIPNRVSEIGDYAFYECSSLTSIVLPESVTSMGVNAFSGCSSLTSIALPEGVTSIRGGAFSRCSSLTSIKIPEKVTSIEESTFSGCSSLTSIEISEGVESIGGSAFYGCSSLTSIVIPEKVTSIGRAVFRECRSLTNITLPDGVTSIGEYAFSDCTELIEVCIPEGVTTLENNLFYNCTNLKNIILPSSLRIIEKDTFKYCSSIQNINIPNGVTTIVDELFYKCSSLQTIIIPDSVTSIGKAAFKYCTSLQSVNIPTEVTIIPDELFYGCESLVNVILPLNITSIGKSAFESCFSLSNIIVPPNVQFIEKSAFYNCRNITEITIPDGVIYLGESAFYYCTNLNSIIIPDSITKIENQTFGGCFNLKNIVIPDSVTFIGDSAFTNCQSLSSINIPENVTSIGKFAFMSCLNLTYIIIPSQVTSIDNGLVMGCHKLESIFIPEGVESIGQQAFMDCSQLTNVYYAGSQASWNNIFIDSYNYSLFNATIYYNSAIPTSEELAALMESANLNSIPVSDSASDLPEGIYLPEPEYELREENFELPEKEEFGLLQEQSNLDKSVFFEEEQLAYMSETDPTFTVPLADDGLSTLPFTTGSGQQIQSTFSNLVASEEYVLIVAKDITADNLFAVDNLLYIAQGTADTGGSLSFEYFLPEGLDVSSIYARAFGKSDKDLADATVFVDPAVYDGMAQTPDPIVVYDGVVLQEGFDYTVSYSNNDKVGTGYVTVTGKIGYTGFKTVPFTITNGVSIVGDLNYDGSVDARDLVLLTRYVAGWNVSIREDLADINGDETVDGQDVIMLTRYLAGWGDEYKPVA